MEFLNKTLSYSQFQYLSADTATNSVSYVIGLKTLSGFTSYNEDLFNYTDIAAALYGKFTYNSFTTSPNLTSGYTIVNLVEPHSIAVGEYILLNTQTGDSTLTGLNKVIDVGNANGANPDNNVWIKKGYSGLTTGVAIEQINEVLGFFKGFNIQPTYDSVNTYITFIENYLISPDVKSFINVGVNEFYSITPRRLFNDFGYKFYNSTGGTQDAQINIPILLTQTIKNIGLYELPYSAITDTKDCNVLEVPDFYYSKYGYTKTTVTYPSGTNSLPYIMIDGITANTYSDLYDIAPHQVSGTTTDQSLRVRKYSTDGIRSSYLISATPTTFTYTLNKNAINGINAGYIEFTSTRPLISSTKSTFNFNSAGRSQYDYMVGNTGRTFTSLVHDEINDGLVLEIKIKNDVFIDKGVFSPFEKVYKLGYLRTIEDITSFERGEFNVVKDLLLSTNYIMNNKI